MEKRPECERYMKNNKPSDEGLQGERLTEAPVRASAGSRIGHPASLSIAPLMKALPRAKAFHAVEWTGIRHGRKAALLHQNIKHL